MHVWYKEKVTIEVSGNSESVVYDGQKQSISGYAVSGAPEGVSVSLKAGVRAEAQGKDAGTYAMGLSEESFNVGGENAGKYAIELVVKDGALTIGKRSVTLTSEGAERAYNGEALTNETVTVSGDGFIEGEGASYRATGSQTQVGSSKNSIEYSLNKGTKAENYAIETVEGMLRVTDRSEEERYQITVVPESKTAVYTGEEQSVAGFERLRFTVDSHVYTVSGLSAGAAGKDAGEYLVNVSGSPVVKDAEGHDVTEQFKVEVQDGAKLTIEKRPVTIRSGSDEKEYDGEALTNDTVTGEGFVKEEGITGTASGRQVEAGESKNPFSYEAKAGTDLNNYAITEEEGTLKVTERTNKYQVTIELKDVERVYTGESQSVECFEEQSFTAENGKTYTISKVTAKAEGQDVIVNGGAYACRVDQSQMVIRDEEGRDVTKEFSVAFTGGSLTITPIAITIKPQDRTQVYNGHALTAESYHLSGAFVGQDGIVSVSYEGSQRAVGQSESRISRYQLSEGTSANNYVITTEPGRLEVTGLAEEDKLEIRLTPNGATAVYNGAEQSVEGFQEDLKSFSYEGESYTISGIEAGAKGTDAGAYEVKVTGTPVITDIDGKDVTEQFRIEYEKAQLVVEKAGAITVTASKESAYTGEEQSLIVAEAENKQVAGELQGEDQIVLRGAVVKGTDAGSYTELEEGYELRIVDAKGRDVTGNYEGIRIEAQLTIRKAESYSGSVSLEDWTYGEAQKEEEISVSGGDYGQPQLQYQKQGESGYVSEKPTEAGSYKVRAVWAATENCEAITAEDSFTIHPREITLKAKDAYKIYGEEDPAFDYEVTEGSLAEGDSKESLGSLEVKRSSTAEGVGTYTDDLRIEIKAGSSNYQIQTEPGTFKIYAASIEGAGLRAEGGSFPYDGKDHAVKAELVSAEGYEILYSTDEGKTWSTQAPSVREVREGVKKVKVKAVREGYNDLTAEPVSLEVTPRPVSIHVEDSEKTYGEADPSFTGEAEGLVKAGDLGEIRCTRTNAGVEEAGVYEDVLIADYQKNSNYSVTVEPGTFTIRAQSLSAEGKIEVGDPEDTEYNGESQQQKVLVKEAGESGKKLEEGKDYTVSYSEDTTHAGTVTMTIQGTGNYSGEVVRSYEITKREIVLRSADDSRVYSGSALKKDEVSVIGEKDFVEGDAVYHAVGEITEVGETKNTIEITWKNEKVEESYKVSLEEGTLTVTAQSIDEGENPETQVSVGELADVIYNGESQEQSPQVTGRNGEALTEGIDYSISYSSDTTNAGSVTVTITGEGNYSGSVTRTYQILPRRVAIQVRDAEKVYGTRDPMFSGEAEGLIGEGDLGEIRYERKEGGREEAGLHPRAITASYRANANYEVVIEEGDLTIRRQSITPGEEGYQGVRAGEAEDVIYNGQSQEQSPQVTGRDGEALTEGTDYSISYSVDTTNAGTVTVRITGEGNYQGEITRTYEILPARLSITTESAERAYNGAELRAGGSVSGLVNGESATLRTLGSQTEAGSSENGYELIWDGTARESNYVIEEESLGMLRVVAAPAAEPVTPAAPVVTPPAPVVAPPAPVEVTEIEEPAVPLGETPEEEEESYTLTEEEETEIEENETPLGNLEVEGEHECCILHLILLMVAFMVELYYTHDRKKRQKRMFELRKELEETGR